MKTVLNRCKYNRDSNTISLFFPLKSRRVENIGRQIYKLQFSMIAALKRNLRSQESTRKEQLVPGEPGKDGKEECILTLVSKKK